MGIRISSLPAGSFGSELIPAGAPKPEDLMPGSKIPPVGAPRPEDIPLVRLPGTR